MELRVASAPLHVYMADIRLTLYGSKVASFAREFGPFIIQQRIIPPIDWILSRRSHPKALIGVCTP